MTRRSRISPVPEPGLAPPPRRLVAAGGALALSGAITAVVLGLRALQKRRR